MLKEGARIGESSNESIEKEPRFSKEALKNFLETREVVTDSGRSGIVFRIGPEELSPDALERMTADNEDDPEGALSIKALKVFNLDYAKKEFESLQEARRIILEKMESSAEPTFRIPRAINFEEVDVDEKTQQFLNRNGASIVDGRVGTITMDWIEGKNLAVYLHDELLKRLPEDDKADDDLAAAARNNYDFQRLPRALEKSGFVFPKELFSQLKGGIEALHKGKLWHNDLHFGNIIVRPDGQLYAIDFADATHEKREIHEVEGEFHLSDENILHSLEPLTRTAEEKRKMRDADTLKEWDDRIAAMDRQPGAMKQYTSIKSGLDSGNAGILETYLMASSSSDRDVENYIATLLRLSRESEEYRAGIQLFLAGYAGEKRPGTRSFLANRLQALRRAVDM